jgi:hypothetical protein
MLRRASQLFIWMLWTAGCTSIYQLPDQPTFTPMPAVVASPSLAPLPVVSPTAEPPDTGWQVLQPGLERRMVRLFNDQDQYIESLYIWRLDQSLFRLDVAYQETPQSLEEWQAETKALMVVNGSYFWVEGEQYFPSGLIILEGQAMGSPYESFAGMLAIVEGWSELRWLAEEPYDPAEPLAAGLQSFPLLVKPGGELGFPVQFEDNIRARRTVIGQDREGRLLLIVTPRGHFTLHQLSLYLTESDLNLDIAMNLDGGPSTGALVADPPETIPSQSVLPIVILVYPR